MRLKLKKTSLLGLFIVAFSLLLLQLAISRREFRLAGLIEEEMHANGARIRQYERQWIPKEPENTNVALVIPFVYRQKSRLELQMALWNSLRQVSFSSLKSLDACNVAAVAGGSNRALANFTLVWYIDTVFNQTIEHFVTEELFQSLGPVKECFRGGQLLLAANLSPAENKHPYGPCAQFFGLFHELPQLGFDYFFIMEPDVLPVRPHWLEALTRELPIPVYDEHNQPIPLPYSKDFWVLGSTPLSKHYKTYGNLAGRVDLHLNGNAFFKLSDPGFENFIRIVKLAYPSTSPGHPAGKQMQMQMQMQINIGCVI
jgi:hypothetical protein